MKLYRIVRDEFKEDLSGRGSFLFGGRWNSEGVHALYTSQHRSLALLETLAHVPISALREHIYYLLEIEVKDSKAFEEIAFTQNSQEIGDQFLKKREALGFKAPSIIFKEEFNFIVNPLHESFSKQVKIAKSSKLEIDKRFIY